MLRNLISGLCAGGLLLVVGTLGGCSTANSIDQTAAISQTAQPAQMAMPAKPPLPDVNTASCEQLGTELSGFKTDKIPDKLAQFGQTKYTPNQDEMARFTRYVAVSGANKTRCGVAKKQVAQVTKKKTAATVAAATKTKKAPATVAAQPVVPAVTTTSMAPAASAEAETDGDTSGVTTTTDTAQ